MTLYLLTRTDSVRWESDRAMLVRADSLSDALRVANDNGVYWQDEWTEETARYEVIEPNGSPLMVIRDNVGA